jgi:hypothetical protein
MASHIYMYVLAASAGVIHSQTTHHSADPSRTGHRYRAGIYYSIINRRIYILITTCLIYNYKDELHVCVSICRIYFVAASTRDAADSTTGYEHTGIF